MVSGWGCLVIPVSLLSDNTTLSTLPHRALRAYVHSLITEFIKEVSPLLPNPCHYQTMIGLFIPHSVCLRR